MGLGIFISSCLSGVLRAFVSDRERNLETGKGAPTHGITPSIMNFKLL